MGKKDKQHYISQSYLRNFSDDMVKYLFIRESLTSKERKKFKEKMKIHFYDIENTFFDYWNIKSLGRVDHYLFPSVDTIVKKTENNLHLLREIIENRSEDFLYQNNNQETLWEIANCFRAKCITFRWAAQEINSLYTGKIISKDTSRIEGSVEYTEVAAELFQTMNLTDDPEILLPLFLKSFKIIIPKKMVNENLEDSFLKLDENQKKEFFVSLKKQFNIQIEPMIPRTVYPILIENKTSMPFITGDDCVPKGEVVLNNISTTIISYHFPIAPDLAIMFLEKKEFQKHIARTITSEYEVYNQNRLIFNCSQYYLFSNETRSLRVTTLNPKEKTDFYKIIRNST